MVTKEVFTDLITSYQKFEDSVERFDKAITGKSYPSVLFETSWYEAVGRMLDVCLSSYFTDEGIDWIYYYLWEDTDDKAAYVKQDKDMFNEEEEIRYPLDTLDELWNFLLTDKKLYFKDV